jgi:hypothetical protein
VFAAPTYLFVATILALILIGAIRVLSGALPPIPPPRQVSGAVGSVGLFLVLHAYASGTTALTGVEAISNGIPIFRPVEWQNARTVLTWMGAILAVLFGGTAFLASRLHPVPTPQRTLLSELARAVFGRGTLGRLGYLLVQITTTGILIFAANTSFADFPRLSSFAARDRYLPAVFTKRGWRLALSSGILSLAVLATVVTVVLGANVESLIPLFAVGAFSAFTFSQAGMTARHLRLREEGWRHGLAINGLGAVLSGAALIVIMVAKFSGGAWVALIVVPFGAVVLTAIRRHYARVERTMSRAKAASSPVRALEVLLIVSELDEALERAVRFAESVHHAGEVHAVSLGPHDPALAAAFEARYERELRFESSGRRGDRARRVVRRLRRQHADRLVLVIVPEKVQPSHRPRRLAGNRAGRLERAIRRERGTAVAVLRTLPEDDSLLSARAPRHVAVVLVDSTDIVAERAVVVGRLAAGEDARLVHFAIDDEETTHLKTSWEHEEPGLRLQIEPAPYREIADPLISLVRKEKKDHGAFVTVVRGVVVPRWWQRPLHVDEARGARAALLQEPATALVEVPYAL